MKLKFTLLRAGGDATDLVATLDSATTVADLAAHLAAADPDGSVSPNGPGGLTMRLRDHENNVLDPTQLVVDSGLFSGATVSVTPAGTAFSAGAHATAAATLTVLSGPDAGTQVPLPRGSSTVGRDPSCDVVLSDPLVSRRHARVNVGELVEVLDLGSANGLSVGDLTVPRAALRPNDVVRIGDTRLSIALLHAPRVSSDSAVDFVRSPRLQPRFEGVAFQAPEPPERPHAQRLPVVALLAPLLMGALLYLVTRSPSSLIFVALSPMMLLGNAFESRFAGRAEFKKAVAAFRVDLDGLVEEMRAAGADEAAARRREHPAGEECVAAVAALEPLTWTRRPDEEAFGQLRFGLGRRPSRSRVEMPRTTRAPRELGTMLTERLAPFEYVEAVPVVASLRDGALGVSGPRPAILPVARSLLVQVVALHSPAEVLVAAFLPADAAGEWDWLKWLPHSSSPQSVLNARHLVSAAADGARLLLELEQLLDRRVEAKEDDGGPATVVLVDGEPPVESSRLVALAERGAAHGIHVVWLAADTRLLPAACRTYLEVHPDGTVGEAGFLDAGESVAQVQLDRLSSGQALEVARRLAPVTDAGARNDDQSDLPRTVSQFALIGTEVGGFPEAVIERWRENTSLLTGPYAPSPAPRRAGSLRAVVGQSTAGPHALDLRVDGPHALVGGTTGAGKSELLQSWILSLAAAHSPQRVTFLLVDYKGGSAFSDCVNLPHTIGLVTDLSPHMVRRALTSLSAELRYREELLARHDAKDLVELESQGVTGAPPSLVIVVDEFAALVKEVPEFVDGVVNVAQRGRSLGLHLILATQRPAGVIKDNLRANTNLRVALRMADEADSVDVLGSDTAATFDPALPGRAISKAGPRHLVPFQAAYAGGWTSNTPERPEIVVEELRIGLPRRWELPTPAVTVAKDREQTDIKRLVRTIRDANRIADIPLPRKAWLPVLEPTYELGHLPNPRRDDQLVFGVADDPERQDQPVVSFNPDREGNLVVYGTGGSGKSTLLRTLAIAAGFTVRGGPCHVYGLDFGSRGLAMLEELPHVGSVVQGSDHERVVRLLTWLRRIVDERALRYSRANAATITGYRTAAQAPDEPRILLLLDGITAFRQSYESSDRARWVDVLTGIASEGRPVGVHVALSSDHRAGMTTALASAVQRRVVLRMAAEDDYLMLGVPADVLSLQSSPGRGLLEDTEVQVAVLGADAEVAVQAAAIRSFAASMRRAGVASAPPIRSLPEQVALGDLEASAGRVVIGLESDSLGPVDIQPRGGFVLTGPPASGRTTSLHSLLLALRRGLPGVEMHYIGHRRSTIAHLDLWRSASFGVDEAVGAATRLAEDLAVRPDSAPRVVVVVESAGDLVSSPADSALQRLAKVCLAEDHLFVAEGETSTLGSSMGYLSVVKSSRRGLVLQPDQENGTGLLRTPFPRVNRNEFPAGRGLLVGAGRVNVVQVALPWLDDVEEATG